MKRSEAENWKLFEDHWDEPEYKKRSKVTYTDKFTVYDEIEDKYICTSVNETGGSVEVIVQKDFLFAHDIAFGDTFIAEVDYGGGIVLETIQKVDDE